MHHPHSGVCSSHTTHGSALKRAPPALGSVLTRTPPWEYAHPRATLTRERNPPPLGVHLSVHHPHSGVRSFAHHPRECTQLCATRIRALMHPPSLARRPHLTRFILGKSRDGAEAYGCMRRLRLQLLDKELESLNLVEVIDSFEARLGDRRNVLAEAEAHAGSTADSITTALLDELRNIRSSGEGADSVTPGAADPAIVSGVTSIESALTGSHSAAFRRITTQLSSIDTTTVVGQRDALATGFEGNCIIALCASSSPLRRRETLSQHATPPSVCSTSCANTASRT